MLYAAITWQGSQPTALFEFTSKYGVLQEKTIQLIFPGDMNHTQSCIFVCIQCKYVWVTLTFVFTSSQFFARYGRCIRMISNLEISCWVCQPYVRRNPFRCLKEGLYCSAMHSSKNNLTEPSNFPVNQVLAVISVLLHQYFKYEFYLYSFDISVRNDLIC